MEPFKIVSISPDYFKGHGVQWEIDSLFPDDPPYTFSIEVSDDINFNKILSSKNVGNNFFGIEDSNLLQTYNNNFLIRIRLQTSEDVYYSNPQYILHNKSDRNKYLQAAEIMRKELILYSRAGHKVSVLKRLAFGTATTAVLDPVSGVPLTYGASGYGTGIEGGFYPPYETYFRIESWQNEVKLNQEGLGVNDLSVANVSMPGFPLLSVKDIVVDEGYRHIISKVDTSLFPGTHFVLKQSVVLNLLPVSDRIYEIEV